MSPRIKVAPSLLSADFSSLAKDIKRVEKAGADMLHVDIMDGHFVPNITIGPLIVKYVRKVTKLPLDVHLMIENPKKYINAFLSAGSDMITAHIEVVSIKEIKAMAADLKAQGVKFGIALNPSTPLSRIKPVLKFVDFVLIMSVNPGFSGQVFIPSVLIKIRELRKIFKKDIAVDGGINALTGKKVRNAGANILAAGSYIFGAKNTKKAIDSLR
ncbi:MAG: ribulose-phosphate 3-epimerase [Candidatus Omnitrophica bacterium CG08_land_8_20_14_0_20_41_16]|uniref:Ribulose-phosphate 3-epimerase n=1 Tax=Candidatus Sherwoodlollariibacterium unditelluris TaxID=1974757 RepID=A0A2G9YKF4_9BACT|nr:MAG: ribulose-phosphate 3-epimerase [Candidatus Omnitrophica bacterium CG23_combo_of_CG06-09_8_20_14_all_41_10]PIS34215.1 MAG: ribulose-phosphate 3-epimerase [Candidatus Omnitrophica bacterium CG08_land_8_20_14_0_20_41_16]